jgi:hypothetical protein
MSNRTTQDDERENMQINIFGLTALQGRSNKYTPDAIALVRGQQCLIELKTCDLKRKSVSTARGVTPEKINEWEKVWWIFSLYKKEENGEVSLVEHYLGDKNMLGGWFDKQRTRIQRGSKTYAGLGVWEEAHAILQETMNQKDLAKLNYSFRKKGLSLNDPKIPWSYIQNNCIKLDGDNPIVSLEASLSDLLKTI